MDDRDMTEETATPERAGVRRTRAVYQGLVKAREVQRKELAEKAIREGTEVTTDDVRVAERIRLTRDKNGKPTIDLDKADRHCKRCGGSGLRAPKLIADPDNEGTIKIPVVCRCVKANGGVAKDSLDRMIEAAEKRGKWEARRQDRRRRKRKLRRQKRRRTLN